MYSKEPVSTLETGSFAFVCLQLKQFYPVYNKVGRINIA
jgi:hypothetical protein